MCACLLEPIRRRDDRWKGKLYNCPIHHVLPKPVRSMQVGIRQEFLLCIQGITDDAYTGFCVSGAIMRRGFSPLLPRSRSIARRHLGCSGCRARRGTRDYPPWAPRLKCRSLRDRWRRGNSGRTQKRSCRTRQQVVLQTYICTPTANMWVQCISRLGLTTALPSDGCAYRNGILICFLFHIDHI